MINIIRSDETANRLEAYRFSDLKVDPNRSGDLFYRQFENELENFSPQGNLSNQALSEYQYLADNNLYSETSVYSAGQESHAASNNYNLYNEQPTAAIPQEKTQPDNNISERNNRLDAFYHSFKTNNQYTGIESPAQPMIDQQVETAASKNAPTAANQTSPNDRDSGNKPAETTNSGKQQDANNYIRINTDSKTETPTTKESVNKKSVNILDTKKIAESRTKPVEKKAIQKTLKETKTTASPVNAENSLKMKKIQTIANIRSKELKAELAKLDTGSAFIKFRNVKKAVVAEKSIKDSKKTKIKQIKNDSGEKPELDAANISPKSDIVAKTKRAKISDNENKPVIKEKIVHKNDSQENIQIAETKSTKTITKTETIKTAAKPTQTSTYDNVRLADVAKTTLGIAKSLPADSIHTARLVLNPKSLGTVFVKITLESNKAKLSFRANSPEILVKLEEQLPGLKDKLAKVGISANEFDFGLQSDDKESAGGKSQGRSSYERYKDSKLRSEFISSLSDINNRIIRQDDAPSD